MIDAEVERVPIAEIHIANPRSRNSLKFQAIVSSIGAVGLKRPITVSRREMETDGIRYDLVCGQGRLEAFLALGESTIPAIVLDAPRKDQFLMSLVENIARRQPSNRALIPEVRNLKTRGYSTEEIARKLGLDRSYIYGVANLLEKGEEKLIEAVEAGKLPVSVAIEIATGKDHDIQCALSDAYERGVLRGSRLTAAKRIIAARIKKQRESGKIQSARKLTADSIVKEYQHQIREQKNLINKANLTRDRLLLVTSAVRELMANEHFVTLLRAEGLDDFPEQLAARLR